MDFIDQLKDFSNRVETLKGGILTEEATKMSLVVPFFNQILGYDVFNPVEFFPEFTADVGIKKGEKVDYAIMENGNPIILIECKWCGDDLNKHGSQLFRYFGTTTAKFGILTNGIVYKFYTDLDEANKMDLTPFLEIDVTDLKEVYINELKKFCKANFDTDNIFSTASELKYSKMIKELLREELDEPSDEFVRFILTDIYSGQKNQKVIDKFRTTIKKSFNSFISEIMNQKISSALKTEVEEPQNVDIIEEGAKSKIVTTEEELESYYIVKGILAGIIDINDISHRDTESYFGILYQDNNRKPICRVKFDTQKRQIMLPDESKNFTRYYIENINEIYKYKDEIIKIVNRYI